MLIQLDRLWYTPKTTIGQITIDGREEPRLFSLEDRIRAPGIKVKGETCIPAGRYRIALNWSNRFKRRMPLVCDVPGFLGIRVHSGNVAADTEGCVLVGMERGEDVVLRSREAYQILFGRIEGAVEREVVELLITNRYVPAELLVAD